MSKALLGEWAEESGSVLGAEGADAREIGRGGGWQLVRGSRFTRLLHETAEGALRGRDDHHGCRGVAADAKSVGLGSRDEDEAVLTEHCLFSAVEEDDFSVEDVKAFTVGCMGVERRRETGRGDLVVDAEGSPGVGCGGD